MKPIKVETLYRIKFENGSYLAFPLTDDESDLYRTSDRKKALSFRVEDETNAAEDLKKQIRLIEDTTLMKFSLEVEELSAIRSELTLDEFRKTNTKNPFQAQFTLNHLFDALSESRETRADVRVVHIRVEDMVRLNQTFVDMHIETDAELFDKREWYDLINNYYTKEKVHNYGTSTKELRAFFDEDMLEFFDEYRPVLKYNGKKLDIDEFLHDDVELEYGLNTDT